MENIKDNQQNQLQLDKLNKRRQYRREYYLKNKEKQLQANREWLAKNPDKKLAQLERYKNRHPEKFKELESKRSIKSYYKNLEENRKRNRERAAKLRADPIRNERIKIYKRGGGAKLTKEQFDLLFELQGKKCAICRSDEPQSKIGWHLDHCHKTKRVRFILCTHCNRGLGAFKDDPELMRRAATMIELNQEAGPQGWRKE
jgi:hypothetical protein